MKHIALVLAFALIGCAYVLLAPFELSFPVTWHHADEGFILYKSYLLSLGKTPYVDFDPFWPPAVYYVNGLLFKTFGARIMAVKYGLAAVGFLSSLCLFAISLKMMPRWLSVWCAFAFVFFGPPILNIPYSSWYAVPIGLGGLYAVMAAIERGAIGPVVLAGIAAGMAFSFKQSIGVFAVAAFGLMGVFWRVGENKQNPAEGLLSKFLVLVLVVVFGAVLPMLYVRERTVHNFLLLTTPALVACGLMLWVCPVFRISRDKPIENPSATTLLLYECFLAAGFLGAILPWFIPLSFELGTLGLLKKVLLVGETWRLREMVVPFPRLPSSALIFPATIVVFATIACFLWTRRKKNRRSVQMAGILLTAALLYLFCTNTTLNFLLSAQWNPELYMYLPVVVVAAYAVFFVSHVRENGLTEEAFRSLSVLMYASLMLQQTFPYQDLNHFGFGFAPWIVLSFFLIHRGAGWLKRKTGLSRENRGLETIFVLALLLFFLGRAFGPARLLLKTERVAWGWSVERRDVTRLDADGAGIIFDTGYADMFGQLIRYLKEHTEPDDTIAGLPSLAVVNLLTERLAPTKFVYLWPGYFSQEEVERTAEELRASNPKFVVLSRVPASPHDALSYQGFAAQYPQIARIVDDNYEPEVSFGCFQVLKRGRNNYP